MGETVELTAPMPTMPREREKVEEWLRGVIGSIPVVGVEVTSIEDHGPLLHLIYELGMMGLRVTIRVDEIWVVSTTQLTAEDGDFDYLIVRGATLLTALAQSWEWWSTRIERLGA